MRVANEIRRISKFLACVCKINRKSKHHARYCRVRVWSNVSPNPWLKPFWLQCGKSWWYSGLFRVLYFRVVTRDVSTGGPAHSTPLVRRLTACLGLGCVVGLKKEQIMSKMVFGSWSWASGVQPALARFVCDKRTQQQWITRQSAKCHPITRTQFHCQQRCTCRFV